MNMTIEALAAAYRGRETTATEVTETLLNRLKPGSVYRVVTAERALQQAQWADECFRQGVDLGPLQGIPIGLKDLMDTRGDVSAAGSVVLARQAPADADCPVAARLDRAGAVFIGKTTMTELGFSGLGLNQHTAIPGNALDARRVPGGSSSGSGVAVASGFACAAVGSDTGGSVRIPSSFNGLVGLKPTEASLPMEGVVPASITLDTLGPITRTVTDAWHMWCVMVGKPPTWFIPQPLAKLSFLAPTTLFQEDLEPEVRSGFERACSLLTNTGAKVQHEEVPEVTQIAGTYDQEHVLGTVESFAVHQEIIEAAAGDMDQRVVRRISQGRACSGAEYIRLQLERKALKHAFWTRLVHFDAIVAPTIPILAPLMDPLLASDDLFFMINSKVVRNTRIFNYLGVPAVTLPCSVTASGLSVGFMIATRPGAEHLALSIARAIEAASV